jgi:hypothetical protein
MEYALRLVWLLGIKLFIWTSTFYQNKEIKLDTGFCLRDVFICCFNLQNAISEYFFWNEFE